MAGGARLQNHNGLHVEMTLCSRVDLANLVHAASDEVCRMAGLDEDARMNLGLALREATVNAVKHGNKMAVEKALVTRKNIASCLDPQVTRACVASFMSDFLGKAWRRSVPKAEVDAQLATFDEFAAKVAPDKALGYTLRAIITAPDKRDPELIAKLDAIAGRVLNR